MGQPGRFAIESGNLAIGKTTFLNGISFAHGFGGFSDGMMAYDGMV